MKAVIDTNVLFEGVTKVGSVSDVIVRAWYKKVFEPCYSPALYYEYKDVLGRKLSQKRWERIEPVVDQLIALATPIEIHFSWRPISPDQGDDFVIDCAMNAQATIVTYNTKDFRSAEKQVGLSVMKPRPFLAELLNL